MLTGWLKNDYDRNIKEIEDKIRMYYYWFS